MSVIVVDGFKFISVQQTKHSFFSVRHFFSDKSLAAASVPNFCHHVHFWKFSQMFLMFSVFVNGFKRKNYIFDFVVTVSLNHNKTCTHPTIISCQKFMRNRIYIFQTFFQCCRVYKIHQKILRLICGILFHNRNNSFAVVFQISSQ